MSEMLKAWGILNEHHWSMMDPKVEEWWIADLKSGEHPQIRFQLRIIDPDIGDTPSPKLPT